MTVDQRCEIIRTGLQSITSFPIDIQHSQKEVKIRVKLVLLKDYIKVYPISEFKKCSCWSIVFDTMRNITQLIKDYTCSDENYRMVMKFLASDDFKEREHETCSELSEGSQLS